MTEKGGLIGSLKDRFQKIRDTVAIENWEPKDGGLTEIITPGLGREHLARYRFTRNLFDRWNALLDKTKPPIVVNLGSARGYGTYELAGLFPESQIIGLELQHKYGKEAVATYVKDTAIESSVRQRLKMMTASAAEIPLSGNSTELIVAYELLEHLPRDEQSKMLKEIYRTLIPGGIAIVSFPERYSFRLKGNELVRTGIASNPHHLYEPTVEEARDMATNTGLKVEEEYGQFLVSHKELERVQKVSKVLPLWPLYMWGIRRDPTPQEDKTDSGQVFLTHILVMQKPLEDNPSNRLAQVN